MEDNNGKLKTEKGESGEVMDSCGVGDVLEGGVSSSVGGMSSSVTGLSSSVTGLSLPANLSPITSLLPANQSPSTVNPSPPVTTLATQSIQSTQSTQSTNPTNPTKEELRENAGIASFSSCVFNVANQIIGAGILTIPYSIHGAGVYGSALMLLLSFVLSLLSAHYLTIASEYTRKDTYGGISSVLCRPWVSVFSDVSLTFFNFGTSVSYAIILYDQVDDLLASWVGVSPSFLKERHAVGPFAVPSL